MTILIVFLGFCLNLVFAGIEWRCDSLDPPGSGSVREVKFRCGDIDSKYCLASTQFLCDWYLNPTCDNEADQWTGLCDNLCPPVNEDEKTVNSFKCDDKCERDFLKWCDGKKDCNSGVDEAHCNCTARPTDCSLDWKERWYPSDYLKIFLPIGVISLLVICACIYGLCKSDLTE